MKKTLLFVLALLVVPLFLFVSCEWGVISPRNNRHSPNPNNRYHRSYEALLIHPWVISKSIRAACTGDEQEIQIVEWH